MDYFLEYHASSRLESAALEIREKQGANAFYSLLMAAMRQAGSEEQEKLEEAFPEAARLLRMRYNAPGGRLADETANDGYYVPGVDAPHYYLEYKFSSTPRPR